MRNEKMVMRIFLAFLLCGVLMSVLTFHSYAETEVYDYRESLSEYAQAVAFLNQPVPAPNMLPEDEGREAYLSALMCRTDGTEVDFTPVSARYILAGPEHCFTLFLKQRRSVMPQLIF